MKARLVYKQSTVILILLISIITNILPLHLHR